MRNTDKLRSVDIEELIDLYKRHKSISRVLKELQIPYNSKELTEIIKTRINEYDPNLLRKHATRGAYSIEDIKRAVTSSMCMSDVLRSLGLSTHGECAKVINRLIKQHSIDCSHFDVKQAMQRNKHRWSDEDIFCENSPIPRSTLNKQVKQREILGKEQCAECGITDSYNGKPIYLTIDHINGISNDNRKHNLRWLCPNCHSQTETYCGKKHRSVTQLVE